MKFKIPTEGGDDEINMAPMIDMVFLLLIFFMVSSHLTAIERIPVPLPVADKANVPDEARDRQMITIRSQDESGEEVEFYLGSDEVDLAELNTTIQALLEGNEGLKVYLRADRFVKHKHVKSVMALCAEVGIADIIFGTFESGN